MQRHGIRARGKRRFRVTTDSRHDLPISPNVLNRDFTVSERDKVWVGDNPIRLRNEAALAALCGGGPLQASS